MTDSKEVPRPMSRRGSLTTNHLKKSLQDQALTLTANQVALAAESLTTNYIQASLDSATKCQAPTKIERNTNKQSSKK